MAPAASAPPVPADLEDDLDWEVDPAYLVHLQEKYKGEEFPLFMDELPADVSGNEHLAALQAILHDDDASPAEVAQNFRENGNECFEEGGRNRRRYFDAISAYTQGLSQRADNDKLNAVLLGNRGHAHLVLGHHIECVDDSRAAIRLDPSNVKPYFRAAKASWYLRLFRQGAAFCQRGLTVAPENAALLGLLRQCEAQVAQQEKKRRAAESSSTSQETLRLQRVHQALQQRGVRLVGNQYDVPLETLSRIRVDDDACLHWPVMLLYDEVMVSEMILDVKENEILETHLQVVLPEESRPSWDTDGKYVWDKVALYYDSGRDDDAVVPVGTHNTLQQILGHAKCVAGVPILHVLAKGSPADQAYRNNSIVAPPLS